MNYFSFTRQVDGRKKVNIEPLFFFDFTFISPPNLSVYAKMKIYKLFFHDKYLQALVHNLENYYDSVR